MTPRSVSRTWFELLSSMRFAITLLTVLAIASIIGTVVTQNQPFNNYLNQFGPFWFPVFESLGVFAIYNSAWFLLILVFLVASTSLCIIRQAPQMVREMRSFRTQAREASLRQFAHQADIPSPASSEAILARVKTYLTDQKLAWRENARDGSVLIAAKSGVAHRLGYFLAHGAIILICAGGLLDGNVPLKLQMALGEKQLTTAQTLQSRIPPESRLGENTVSFRGNLFVPEGKDSSLATLNLDDGVLVQDLPFSLKLNKFVIEHYTTGAPKRFASEVVLTDRETGRQEAHTIEVNHPITFRGLTIYQSSFDDGGSRLMFAPHALAGGPVSTLSATVGESVPFERAGPGTTLELTSFRSFNIENMSERESANLGALATLQHNLGSAVRPAEKKDLRNVGPNVQFKLRDATGQAREYQNYMLPITLEGRAFMLTGVRTEVSAPFRFMRIPLDEDGRIETFFALRQILLDARQRRTIAEQFASTASRTAGTDESLSSRLADTADRTLALFADKGFESVGKFLESSVPANEREKAADVFLKILEGEAWEAWQTLRASNNQPRLELTRERAQFVRDVLAAASDAFHYGAPVYLQLMEFNEVRASVFQVTRSPGEPLVFLGSLLLVLGVGCMLYVHERRLFVLIKPGQPVLLAMSSNRKTLDFEAIFARHRAQLTEQLTS